MHITSLQNSRVKLASALQSRARTRRKEGKFVLEGTRLVSDALAQGHPADVIFVDEASLDADFLATLEASAASVVTVTEEIIVYLSDTETPQGVVGIFAMPQPELPAQPERILVLDAVQDPGNMGTILRAAGGAGVQAVILAPHCVDAYNPKVLRAGMGAHFRVPLVERDWQAIRDYTATTEVYLAAAGGETVYSDVDWCNAWTLVIGNEAHGISEKAASIDGTRLRIPMAAATESINAAVATGVILFEAQRQRLAAT